MFRIKICGITNVEDARMVAGAGADAVGLNFYPKSPRYIAEDAARAIVEVLGNSVLKVGLFVNAPAEVICGAFDRLGLDMVQLHGDEPPSLLAELGDRPVLRAFRLGEARLDPLSAYLGECEQLGCRPRMVLIDALDQGAYGGTGKLSDWDGAAECSTDPQCPPLVLAGGLTPRNVVRAIETVGPAAVDTASGVESSPGCKSPELVEAFVGNAREAFEARA